MERKKMYRELDRILSEKRVRDLYIAVRSAFLEQGSVIHGWEHVRRVIVNAVEIGTAERADMGIVMPGIILHDIGFVTHPQEPKRHPEHGSRECVQFLGEWTPSDRGAIAKCIRKHKGRYPGYDGPEPESLEEKVVCDADQLDKFGWIGLFQMTKVYAEYGTKGIDRYKRHTSLVDGLRYLSEIELYTDAGKRRAAELAHPNLRVVAEELSQELELSEGWHEAF